jgi:hypothetical protein
MGQHISYIYFEKAYDSVSREVIYSVLIEYSIFVKLIRLIKTCLNKTYSKVHTGKNLMHFLFGMI